MSNNNNNIDRNGNNQPIENNNNIHMYNLPDSQAVDTTTGELKNQSTFEKLKNISISQVPCLKNSLLYGVGSGMGVLAITSILPVFRSKKLLPFDFAIITFLGVSSIGYPICYYNHNLHNRKVKILMDAQVAEMNRKVAEKKKQELEQQQQQK